MKEISIESLDHLDEVVASNPLVIAKFGKDNCPGCNALDITLQNMRSKAEYTEVVVANVKLEKIGRDEFITVARAAPTTLLYRYGDEVYRLNSFTGAVPFISAVDQHLLSSCEA